MDFWSTYRCIQSIKRAKDLLAGKGNYQIKYYTEKIYTDPYHEY